MAEHRHKRDTDARRKPRAAVVAGPLALLATASAVGMGVLLADPAQQQVISASSAPAAVGPAAAGATAGPTADAATATPSAAAPTAPAPKRYEVVSRRGARGTIEPLTEADKMMAPAAVRRAVAAADTRLFAVEELNVWTAPGEQATNVGLIEVGDEVLVTGRSLDGREEVVVDGRSRWVTAGYLVEEEPVEEVEVETETATEEPEVASTDGSCTNGSSVPSGVSPNVAAVHRAVCAAFPQLTSYGTFRSDGEHAQGIAIDIMVSGSLGWEVAEFVRANRAELGVSYLIYAQKIWSVERGGEGWRSMSDRGSVTANHYDHVHVTTY